MTPMTVATSIQLVPDRTVFTATGCSSTCIDGRSLQKFWSVSLMPIMDIQMSIEIHRYWLGGATYSDAARLGQRMAQNTVEQKEIELTFLRRIWGKLSV
jgi:hypothetical protein